MFLHIQHPPSTTLFPYTTLFRSHPAGIAAAGAVAGPLLRTYLGSAAALRTPTRLLDRKSTRLNSSHSQISYAVFCLKKKTQEAVLLCNCAIVGTLLYVRLFRAGL